MIRVVLGLLFALCTLSMAITPSDPGQIQIVYTVRVDPAEPGVYHFRIDIQNPPDGELKLISPFFAPGAYREITVAPRGGALAWTRLKRFKAITAEGESREIRLESDRTWVVDAKGTKHLTIEYTNVEPGKSQNNRSYLDDKSGLIDGPRSWLYLDGYKTEPVHVRFELPAGWGVAGGLDPTFDPMVFTAKDYDRLADCPTLVGLFDAWTFTVRGVPHRVVAATAGQELRFDPVPFVAMIKNVVEAYVEMFDDVPYEHYTFIYTGGGGGGLEHLTSTTISGSAAHRLSVRGVRSVTAHEFIHTWNVKRLRPLALGPFDYTGPVRVKDLWICEGLTSYYTPVGLWRAGEYNEGSFRNNFGRAIRSYVGNRASWYESSEESSWGVWDGGQLRYYNTGQVLGLAMDLAIREATDNKKSLDDVMRRMYRQHGGYYRHQDPKPGFKSEDWPAMVLAETGVDLEYFWDAHIRNSMPVDWNRYLGYAGWVLESHDVGASGLAASKTEPADDGTAMVVPSGSVFEGLGFKNGDLVLSINGKERRRSSSYTRAFRRLKAGVDFTVSVMRGGKKLEVTGVVPEQSELGALSLRQEEGGLLVIRVPRDLAWYEAGLRKGDIIAAVIGEDGPASLDLLTKHCGPKAKTVTITVQREGQPQRNLKVAVRPFMRPAITGMEDVASPTKRQLAIRAGLGTGTTKGIQ